MSEARGRIGEHGFLVLGSGSATAAGEVELLDGNPQGVERELKPAAEELERIGELGYLSSVTPLLTDAVFDQDRIQEALTLSDRWRSDELTVPEDAAAHIGWHRVRGKILAARGALVAGEDLCRRAVELAEATDFLVPQARALADLGTVLRLAGRAREAEAAMVEAIRRHEEKGNVAEASILRSRVPRTSAAGPT
jgi:hypothetical protein